MIMEVNSSYLSMYELSTSMIMGGRVNRAAWRPLTNGYIKETGKVMAKI